MPSPIRIPWRNRPGWGEYLALRGGTPSHGGFDTYTLPLATIYGTANGGVVIAKGTMGNWGHYIDVRYPAQGGRPAYVQRDCHMNELSGMKVGWEVNVGTALGRVGNTGNARDIFWIVDGVVWWHVHSEVYLGRLVAFSKRTNPLTIWGVSTAGGGAIPLPVVPEETENEMYLARNTEDSSIGSRTFLWGPPPMFPEIVSDSTADIYIDAGVPLEELSRARWLYVYEQAVARGNRYVPGTPGKPVPAEIDYSQVEAMVKQAVAGSAVAIAQAVLDETHRRTES